MVTGYTGQPLTVSGIRFYEAAIGGEALGDCHWQPGPGGYPVITLADDRIEVALEVRITSPIGILQITALAIDPGRVRSGDPATVRFVIGGGTRWRIQDLTLDPRAMAGEMVEMKFRVVPAD